MESEESFKTNLNTVKEMILDEEKIVTYISLSKDLCIHINTGKKLLHEIVKQSSDVNLNVNFILSGVTDENKARTTVCTKEELKNLKTTFKTILYEHVYSVSKGSSQTDHAAYLLLNKFDDYQLCAGLIKNIDCSKHTFDEIGSLKSNSQQAASIESNESAISQKKIKSESKNITNGIKNKIPEEKTNGDVNDKIKTNIKSELVSPMKEISNRKKSNNHNNKSQKGIAGFFNKSNTNQMKTLQETEKEAKVALKKAKVVLKEAKVVLKESKNIEIKEEKMEVATEIPRPIQELEKEVKNKSKKNNTDLNQIKKTSKVDKKRKRVLKVSDSDSDDENDPFADKSQTQTVENDPDDEIPSTPSATNIIITSGIVNPKKRRKIVDKTYTDDEGYILTKKVEVYESCSDNEDDFKAKESIKEKESEKKEVSPKEKKSTLSKKKISPPQKGKQTMLTNFFTRK